MKNWRTNLIKGWKTSLIGLVILTLVTLYIFNKITTEQLLTIIGVLTSVGLFAAKDGNEAEVSPFSEEIGGGGIKNPPKR
jgi:hypothetical protein